MICKEAEKMIPAFLNDSMTESELEAFLDHIKHCEMCEEELSIQLLVSEGMDRLESGASFNLKDSVEQKITLGNERIRTGYSLRKLLYILECVLICGLGACVWLCFYAGK